MVSSSSKAGKARPARHRAEFATPGRAAAARGLAPAVDTAALTPDFHDEIKVTREGFRAPPRDDRAG
ncbi:MAG TPA: hypothetical protein VLJ58_19155 [Ramlibacter sp.]|nr:hypothetical protein [Ramlibacter sp.]